MAKNMKYCMYFFGIHEVIKREAFIIVSVAVLCKNNF